jgi:hypothetical protein
MSEKNHNNEFRFTLYQQDVILCEKVFDADVFNPFTRYSIDIRDLLPQAITRFQKMLSKKRYEIQLNEYDLLRYNNRMIDLYPKECRDRMRYNPRSIRQEIEDKVIKGVECKIGLYINDNPIVERIFYVDGFNPVARYSVDVVDTLVEVVDEIERQIKRVDIKNMWDDYDLINKRGLTINQIRELPAKQRAYLLRSIN